MIADILDTKIEENSGTCYLCKMSLFEYISNLPSDYNEYDIQREIVNNVYLDSLIQTVIYNKHIPPIVLVANTEDCSINNSLLTIRDFKILDGLQRTYRLKTIWQTLKLFFEIKDSDPDIYTHNRIKLSRLYSNKLSEAESSSKALKFIIDFYREKPINNLKEALADNMQWFEVWTGLTPEEEVNKMLVLNAGHKPVKIKHQLELLFRNLVPILKKVDFQLFEIVREKEVSSITYSKQRKMGQFHFSHLVSSIVSFKEAEPITTNTEFISKWQNNDYEIDEYRDVFHFEFLEHFVACLLAIDKHINKCYGDEGLRWIGKEIVLVGIFSALGKYWQSQNGSYIQAVDYCKDKIVSNVKNLLINDFETQRENVILSKVNFGAVNKKAVHEAFYKFFSEGGEYRINWQNHFGGRL